MKYYINTLMVQGTTSDAGKSTLVTALCRYFKRQEIKVAPFKPQNMALNSAVTRDGGEIGRAQAVQAVACGLEAHTDMNPILLKPNSDTTSQVIVHGKAIHNLSAKTYQSFKRNAMQAVLASHHRLLKHYDLIVVEGAGSPAEINLRTDDIANMGFAEQVDCPVILIADIDKGGVFAHIVGTLELLSSSEQQRIIGFVINRFRGDINLLTSGLEWLEQKTAKPVLAVLPYLPNFYLDSEDSIATQEVKKNKPLLNISVPLLPRMSNHTDFDALRLHPEVSLQFVKDPTQIQAIDLIILAGSKSVIADVTWLKQTGWDMVIKQHLRYGGRVMGICGGYQMLGHAIYDPLGIESSIQSIQGLGLLELETTLQREKCLKNMSGTLLNTDITITGYEIHAGVTTGKALQQPVMTLAGQSEGAFSSDKQIIGTYLHGLFDRPAACQYFLTWAGLTSQKMVDLNVMRESGINLITDTLEQHFDFERLEAELKVFKYDKALR